MQTKYIILFWIIALILFTFYCIFRLKYLLPVRIIPNITTVNTASLKTAAINKFDNIRDNTTTTTQPVITDAISYIDNISAKDKITDLEQCKDIYDDNLGVRALGYSTCGNAYTDYFNRNLDPSKTYGFTKSLSDYCPITTKNPLYMQCMRYLLNKFTNNVHISKGVNQDMIDNINKRLHDRSDVLSNIEESLNPYILNRYITDFKINTGLLDSSNQSASKILYDADNYYQTRLGFSKNVFNDIPYKNHNKLQEGFSNVVDPYIETAFFGNYTPIKGQYLAFNNLNVSLTYDTSNKQVIPVGKNRDASYNNDIKTVLLTITDNNTNGQIIYEIRNIDYYQILKNVVILDVSSQTINTVSSSDNTSLNQLLTILGITVPNRIVMTIEQNISPVGVERYTYKLLNNNMDTIMIMQKN